MQLKKIEVQGFKSFADKTEIDFLEGVTTIVGPNGSGKSNISDAIRWVLGEQSIKTLRGSKMEDVIFAGTEARKKVGFAEVSMYLDNSDLSLPVEFKEVVITRKVYRSGESQYLLNGSECRLKDIQELFMDTGVGKDGYSIISQGKIDEILSTKSEERRHIFEEASGIVKYRSRKDEAIKKLENTDVTLSRVHDILSEIENIIEPLLVKSETAKKYLLLKEKLKSFDVKIFIESLEKNKENLEKLDDIIDTLSNDILKEEERSNSLNTTKINLKEKLNEVSLKIEEAQGKYFEMENEAEKLNSIVNVTNKDISSADENIVRLTLEIDEDAKKIEILREEITSKVKKQESLQENKMKFENELDEKKIALEAILKNLNSKDIEINEIKEKIEINTEKKYELKSNVSSMSATLESNIKQITEKEKLNDRNITQKDSVNAMIVDISQELTVKENELNNLKNEEEKLLDTSSTYADKINGLSTEEYKLKQEIMTLKSKYTYLTNLENENEGYYRSVKEALDYSKKNQMDKVYGTVASIISTNEKYEYAIEIALGGYLQNIIVETEFDAKRVISYLKENSLGRVTFLPLTGVREVNKDIFSKVKKNNGVIGMASDLVKFDKKYEKAINLALNNTVIVENLDNAIELSKTLKNAIKIVTLQGELISSNGSITGGQTSSKSAGLLGRQEKIELLKEKIRVKETEIEKFNIGLNELKEKEIVVTNDIIKLKEKIENANIEVATYKEKYENVKKEKERVENLKENSQKMIEELKYENEKLEKEIKVSEESILEFDNYILDNQNIIEEYSRFNKEKSQKMDFLNEDIVNLKISLSSFDESVSSITEMKDKIAQDIDNFMQGINKKEEQINILNNLIVDSKNKIEEITSKKEEQLKFKDEYMNLADNLKNQKEDCMKKQDLIEVDILKLVKNIEKIKEEKSKVESKKVKFDLEIENLKNKMWDDYELTITSAKALVEGFATDCENINISKEAENLRNEIKKLGDVSVSAIEEYKETKARYDFISSQKEDLEKTKEKLENLISNMTSIMKAQFEKQFSLIKENFNETFKELFGGGKADLILSDAENILESGIDIEVQPPGKKLQNMMLLSGGERALTATALLFAILKLKSPPFCILDEIEAALDDINVNRFAEYIKKYSKNTQFIVITHRKGTMEIASCVYGVTMQEYGISKVVSMKLR